jgi:hypothetical protein
VVEENIYGMNQATWVGALAGVGALVFAYLAWRVSKRELGLAQQQAELRPHLVASLNTVAFHDLPPDTLVPHEQAAVVFDITNNGRTAAHGVRCEFRLEGPLGAPDPSMGENLDFEASYIGPKQTIPHTVRVSVYSYGSATARYSCICDEVGESEGVVEFEVRHRPPIIRKRF